MMPTTSRSALPAFLAAGISLLVTVATGLAWLGKPFRLVQLVTLIGLGMITGVSWMQAVFRARQKRHALK
ncbi:MAG TPA: hypothetical protein VH539_11830 [Gemmatimonadaceae bacterium]|jgi:hypothetical protein